MNKKEQMNFYATPEQKKECYEKITKNVYSDDTKLKLLFELSDNLKQQDPMYDTVMDLICAKIVGEVTEKQERFIDNVLLRAAFKGLIKDVEITLSPRERKTIIYKCGG